jgi:hypothetical protein
VAAFVATFEVTFAAKFVEAFVGRIYWVFDFKPYGDFGSVAVNNLLFFSCSDEEWICTVCMQ